MTSSTLIADDRRSLFAFRGFSRLYFHLPVLLPFALSVTGGDLVLSGAAVAAYSLAVALSTMGGMPDRAASKLGIVRLVAVSEAGKLLGLVAVALVPTYPMLLACQLLIGCSFALGAAADGSLPFALVTGERRVAMASALQSVMFGSVVVSAVASGFLFSLNAALPFMCSAFATFAGILSVLRLRRSLPLSPRPVRSPPRPLHFSGPAGIRWWTAYYLVTRSTTMSVYVMLVPATCSLFGLAPESFGLVLCTFGIGGLIAARFGAKLARYLSFRSLATLNLVVTAASICVGAIATYSPYLLAATALLIGIGGGMVRPCTVGGLGELDLAAADQGRLIGRLEQWGGLLTAPLTMASAISLGAGIVPSALFVGMGASVAIAVAVLASIRNGRTA